MTARQRGSEYQTGDETGTERPDALTFQGLTNNEENTTDDR